MKWFLILISTVLLVSTSVKAQDPDCCGWKKHIWTNTSFDFQVKPRALNLPDLPDIHSFIVLPTAPGYSLNVTPLLNQVSKIFDKTPIQHRAFFCKIEDLTQKKFGVMIQFHVGDYNSTMDQKIPR